MGCPIDLVCDKGGGSALMTRPAKVRGLVEGGLEVEASLYIPARCDYFCFLLFCCASFCLGKIILFSFFWTIRAKGLTKRLSCPITLKMRIGWNENKPNAHQVIRSVELMKTGNISAFMVHGRSRLQRYSRLADWQYINSVASGTAAPDIPPPSVPIIGNGDIYSYEEWEEHKAMGNSMSTCCMLARGALIKPWLPTEIKESRHWDISATERFDLLKKFVHFGLEHWGSDQKGVNNVRRFLLEWLSFLHRYIPVGLLEVLPPMLNERPPAFKGRNELETLMASKDASDWVKISEMLLGPVPASFKFLPKHKSNAYSSTSASAEGEGAAGESQAQG
jgi:tRNA-dihydrouridine synthase 3